MATTIPKEGLRSLVAAILGLPVAFIIWEGESKGPVDFAQDAKRVVLNPSARRAVGVDEEKRAYVPDPDNTPDGLLVETTYTGQRIVTISVRAENMGSEEGFDLLERLRVLLAADKNRAALNTLDVALASTGNVQTLPAAAGNRKISVAQLDVFLNQHVVTVVTEAGDTYIESVETTGDEESDLVIAGSDVIDS